MRCLWSSDLPGKALASEWGRSFDFKCTKCKNVLSVLLTAVPSSLPSLPRLRGSKQSPLRTTQPWKSRNS